jgi:hypothetical protein
MNQDEINNIRRKMCIVVENRDDAGYEEKYQ